MIRGRDSLSHRKGGGYPSVVDGRLWVYIPDNPVTVGRRPLYWPETQAVEIIRWPLLQKGPENEAAYNKRKRF